MNSIDFHTEIILDNPNGIHGYKAFDPDWSCMPGGFWKKRKQYSCPGMFYTSTRPSVCNHGMHFCERLEDIFNYYSTRPDKPKVAEVIAWGTVAKRGDKCSTNKLEIVREIPWAEVVERTNSGADCTGVCNSGSGNTGNYNTGNYNTGRGNIRDWNTGDCNAGGHNVGSYNFGSWNAGTFNAGDHNTGDCNTGDWNTGNYNAGACNTGDYNTGKYNTGDWNLTNFSAGCFCTKEPEILMFNKPSGMTLRQWRQHPACHLLQMICKNAVKWIDSYDMTDKEKEAYPTYETTCGYLKVFDKQDAAQQRWDEFSWDDKNVILQLPNFDADIFYQCTGIRVTKEKDA